jgi:hypothetical protein
MAKDAAYRDCVVKGEREQIAKHVFPALRKRYESRGVVLGISHTTRDAVGRDRSS